jgi:hypothetical protein
MRCHDRTNWVKRFQHEDVTLGSRNSYSEDFSATRVWVRVIAPHKGRIPLTLVTSLTFAQNDHRIELLSF